MADPQAQNAGTATPAQTPPPDSGGVDLSGIRVRTLQQAKSELPQPKITPPWEEEPELNPLPTTKLGQAYEHAKQFLQTHEQHLSEKVLAPFRQGLDNLASDLEAAASSGHTKSGGELNPVTRGLVGATGVALRAVPVGTNLKETAAALIVPPEFPEGRALSKEIKAGESVAEKAAPNLEGLRTREVSPAPQKSPFRIAAETPEKHAEFQEAVKNTEGAELHDKGLSLDVVRQQKPDQAGERAIRTGVFFLPEKKSPYQRYYTTGRQGYGGSQRIEGRTTFENPIIAKGASGGKVPERAYDAINGPGAYDEMRQDVLDATTHSFGYGEKDPKVLTQRVADVLEKHGGNPDLAADIVRTSKEGNTLPYAVQEHIVASSVRKAGHDGIIGYSKVKGQHRLSEVFDLRRDKYPISTQLFEASPTSPDLTGIRTREVSPATTVESKVVSPAKEVPKLPQHEPVGIHEDDVPRGSKTPDVDWEEQDLQDSAKTVNEETIAKDYGPKRKGAKVSVYKSHIPLEDLPSAKIVEEEEIDPELRNEDWRENYQGLLRSTTPPIKVRVNPKGEMEILDGNHRAQLWEDAGMTHAPAWVIDERGKGIENLSEDERAERAEIEAEEKKPVTAFEKINLSKDIPNDEAVKTEVPISKLSVSNKAYVAAESDIAKGRGSKTEGPIQVFYNPDNKQFLVADEMHRVVEAHQKGVKTLPAQLWSGYSDYIANVHPKELKNLGSQTEQAAKSWSIHDLGKDHNIPSDEGYVYHATNHDRARDIAESGLDVHKPSYGTDQEAWPDGSTDKRSYFTKQADHAWQFSPEEGKPALLRMKQDSTIHSRESTGDFYSKKKILANKIEVLGDDKQWHPISELSESKAAPKTEPKKPLHERLFDEALKGQEKTPAKSATRTTLNASGESAASQEAINRAAREKSQGTKRFRVDTRSGRETPIIGTEAVDAKASPYDVIVQRIPGRPEVLLDSGSRARPYRPKMQ